MARPVRRGNPTTEPGSVPGRWRNDRGTKRGTACSTCTSVHKSSPTAWPLKTPVCKTPPYRPYTVPSLHKNAHEHIRSSESQCHSVAVPAAESHTGNHPSFTSHPISASPPHRVQTAGPTAPCPSNPGGNSMLQSIHSLDSKKPSPSHAASCAPARGLTASISRSTPVCGAGCEGSCSGWSISPAEARRETGAASA